MGSVMEAIKGAQVNRRMHILVPGQLGVYGQGHASLSPESRVIKLLGALAD